MSELRTVRIAGAQATPAILDAEGSVANEDVLLARLGSEPPADEDA